MLKTAALFLFAAIASASSAQAPEAEQLLQSLLESSGAEAFEQPSGPSVVNHGPHSDARSESWTIVAHLTGAGGASLSVQVSIARLGLKKQADTALDIAALYRGHVVMSSDRGAQIADERLSRGLGAAGEGSDSTWIDDWTLDFGTPDQISLNVRPDASDISLTIKTRDAAPLLLPDDDNPLRGYSLPVAPVQALIDGEAYSGIAWFDHLWGDVPLPGGPLAYDRLIVHLDDGAALSLLRTRRSDGAGIETLDGALIVDAAEPLILSDETVALSRSGLVGEGLDLTFRSLGESVTEGFQVPLKTRFISVGGTRNGEPVTGVGTFQLSEGAE